MKKHYTLFLGEGANGHAISGTKEPLVSELQKLTDTIQAIDESNEKTDIWLLLEDGQENIEVHIFDTYL